MSQELLQTFTPDQSQVLALLAEGHTIGTAADIVGVHRNTIRNWGRADAAFAREVELATSDQIRELAPQAAAVLEEILNNPEASPSLRLRAALAVLKITAASTAHQNAKRTPDPVVQRDVHPVHIPARPVAQSRAIATIRRTPEPGRNSTCPCGSGLKYKRCCANRAQPAPLLAA